MTEAQLAQIEADRKRREDELLLLLLLLVAFGAAQALALPDDDPAEIIRDILTERGVPEIAGSMADAHLDAFGVFVRSLSRAPSRDVLVRQYEATGREAVDAMVETIDKSVKLMGGDLLSGLVAAGYSRTNSTGIELGAERNIVSASNAGIVNGAIVKTGGEVTGLRHISVIDDRTTATCTERDGLKLPIGDTYWLLNWPSLHWRCRSVLEPIVGAFEASAWRPVTPPAVGFGRAPASILGLLNRKAA